MTTAATVHLTDQVAANVRQLMGRDRIPQRTICQVRTDGGDPCPDDVLDAALARASGDDYWRMVRAS